MKNKIKLITCVLFLLASNVFADSFYSYDNEGNWANTFEYDNGSSSTFYSDGTWSNTFDYGNSSTTTFSDGTWVNEYRY